MAYALQPGQSGLAQGDVNSRLTRSGRLLRCATGLSLAYSCAMVAARVYDQEGHLACVGETGDRYENAYGYLEMGYLACVWATTCLAALVAARNGADGRRLWLAGLMAPHVVLSTVQFGVIGACP